MPAPAATPNSDAAPAAEEDPRREESKEHFTRGVHLMREGRWAEALSEFLRSRELYASRASAQNAAICLSHLRRYDESLELLESLVREFPNLAASDREAVDVEIERMAAFVGSIEIRTDETRVSVVIDGRERGVTPLVSPVRVTSGSHVVVLYKEGFRPHVSTARVEARAKATVEARLEMLARAGRLRVAEATGKIVQLLVDGVAVGATPWEGPLALGEHTILLRGEGNVGTQPASAPIRLDELTTITLAVEPLEGQLRIEPTPTGARVAIDGVVVGRGIWEGRLRASAHRIEVAAEGFLPEQRQVALRPDRREILALALERDPASLWRAARPARVTLDGHLGALASPSLGGDAAKACAGACDSSVGLGFLTMFHAGYELGIGLGFSLHGGYLRVSDSVTGAPNALKPLPRGTLRADGTTTDDRTLSGAVLGASIAYHRGDRWPGLVRLGGGVVLGSLRDRRSGRFASVPETTGGTSIAYDYGPATEDASARFADALAEVRLGRRIGHFELGASLTVLLLFSLSQPKWENSQPVLGGRCPGAFPTCLGFVGFDEQALTATTLLLVSPGISVRYDL